MPCGIPNGGIPGGIPNGLIIAPNGETAPAPMAGGMAGVGLNVGKCILLLMFKFTTGKSSDVEFSYKSLNFLQNRQFAVLIGLAPRAQKIFSFEHLKSTFLRRHKLISHVYTKFRCTQLLNISLSIIHP